MSLNCQTQTGAYTKKVAHLKSQSQVEIKFAQDIGEVLVASPHVSLNSAEVSSGRVSFGGRIILTIVYIDGDGKLCRMQKGAEFSHYADDDCLAPSQRADCALSCERLKLKREGSQYIAAVVLGADIDVYDSAERSFITDIDGAVCLKDSGSMYTLVNFSGESEVEDEFLCVADDVLAPSAEALVLNCTVGSGVAEVSGEIYLSLLAVRDSKPVALSRVIPFKCEVACDEGLLNRRACCRADVKSLSINCKVNEEKSKCGVQMSATLAFSGHFYEEEQITLVSDAFSKTNKLELGFGEESVQLDTDIKIFTEKTSGLCATKAKLDYTCAFLAAVEPGAEYARTADGVEGAITATLLYEQGGELKSTEINMPFTLPLAGLSSACKQLKVAVCGLSLRQRAEGECEGEVTLKICGFDGETKNLKYLTGAECGAEIAEEGCAVSVYLPAAGDGLWETAKRLSETPDNLVAANPDLKFPLTGKERILVFRGKDN